MANPRPLVEHIKSKDDILILTGAEVQALLVGKEPEVIAVVRAAYEAHARHESSLPHSTFLRFPHSEKDRIIALPAYLGGEFNAAGIKWIASFPDNVARGVARASAVIILNSAASGRPEAILEGSIISAKRTAASAALAAIHLKGDRAFRIVGIIGCGVINFEIARFLTAMLPEIASFLVFDLQGAAAEHFREKCRETFDTVDVSIAQDIETVLKATPLISIATTVIAPHLYDLSSCKPGTVILHISLRDLSPEVILSSDNIVDDVDHVCRAATSIHLAEQVCGNREFIRCILADITTKKAPAARTSDDIQIFSPFGLGVLDLAVSQLVCRLARQRGLGTWITSFIPEN